MPNVLMFVIGTKSLTLARSTAGTGAAALCGGPGNTVSSDGVVPMLHSI